VTGETGLHAAYPIFVLQSLRTMNIVDVHRLMTANVFTLPSQFFQHGTRLGGSQDGPLVIIRK